MDDHDTSDGTAEYEVGYGKPPKHSRFKPGQSGNPRGRRRGTRGLKTDLHAELSSMLTIQINGKPVRGTRQQLMIKALTTRAATGDVKAAKVLLDLISQAFGFEDRGGERARLSPHDQALLDRLLIDPEAIGRPCGIDIPTGSGAGDG